jgi:hypothetical protein
VLLLRHGCFAFVRNSSWLETEPKRPGSGNHVEVGKLQRIIGNAARHAGQTEEVLDEERKVEEEERQPRSAVLQAFVT